MDHHHHNHHAGAPVVQAVNQPAARDLGQNVLDAVVSVAGSGGVIEGQQDAGESLHHEEEHGNAAKKPGASRWSREYPRKGNSGWPIPPRTVVKPCENLAFDLSHDFVSSD